MRIFEFQSYILCILPILHLLVSLILFFGVAAAYPRKQKEPETKQVSETKEQHNERCVA